MRRIVFLYLFGFCLFSAILGILINTAYQTSTLKDELSQIRKEIQEIQIVKDRDDQFEADLQKTIMNLLRGQQVLSFSQLRIHHFVEPHSDNKFYPGCYECEKEKRELQQNRDRITKQ